MAKLAELLVQWIQAPDWGASKAFLNEHAEALLTDEAEAVLQMLQQANPDNATVAQHIALLRACRQQSIEEAYRALGE